MLDHDRIRRFVQDVLGCACPNEVFKEISVQPVSSEIGSIIINFEIRIGGRLLIFVSRINDVQAVSESLDGIFRKGKEIRDSKGFNRFRFVVATNKENLARDTLIPVFKTLKNYDEKTHLHIISIKELPDFFN